jgi:hypothetical protein
VFLRENLRWRTSRNDRFVAALSLGALHGESHRSAWCFSNRMPRTISTKPAYSVRWWRSHRMTAPDRNVFSILRAVAQFRYTSPLPERRGRVVATDARTISRRFLDAKRRVSLVVTSPPYLDTTDYREDQWLRLWFLGGSEYPCRPTRSDDRHRDRDDYWQFLTEAWAGMAPLLRDGAHVVVRIGGRRIGAQEAASELRASLNASVSSVKLMDSAQSRIHHGQLRAFRPGAVGTVVEHDFRFRIG